MHGSWRICLDTDVSVIRPVGDSAGIRSRKARAMIAWLALLPERRAPRRELIGLLWSDRGRDQALASLRQLLTELRGSATGLIDADNDSVWIAPDGVTCSNTASGSDFLVALDNLDPALDRWLAKARATLPTALHPPLLPAPRRAASPASTIAPWLNWLGAGAVALSAAYYGVSRPPISPAAAPQQPVIAIVPFGVVPDDPSTRGVAERIVTDARAWIPGDRATVHLSNFDGDRLANARKLGADWVVSGDVLARDGRVRTRVETASGVVLWTKDIDVADGRVADAGARIANRIGSVITCALGGPPKRRAPDVLVLLMTACDRGDATTDSYSDEAALEASRRLVQRAPDDALAQAYYGTGQAIIAWDMPPELAKQARANAARALDASARLDPRVGEQWLGRALLVEDQNAVALAEGYLRRGLAVEPNSSHLNAFLSTLLANAGYGREAEIYARRAMALDPAKLLIVTNAVRIMAQNGKHRAALDVLDAADARHAHDPELFWSRIMLLMYGGAPAHARALLTDGTMLPVRIGPDKVAELRRIASAIENPGSADAAALAKELVARSRASTSSTIRSLAAIARPDLALDLAMTHDIDAGILFFPGAESALRHPRFPEVARHHGLWAYWQTTGRWPDICRDPTLPWHCGQTADAKS